jgi:prepilin-type N-terminal cleavage/methylation domain-containing protein
MLPCPRPRRNRDDGFTLVELLIAMVIMGTAVIALVAAMGNIFVATANNRGYSRLETNMRAFAESMQGKANFRTTLSSAITAAQTSLTIDDAVTAFGDTPATGSFAGCTSVNSCTNFPFFIVVDTETMKVTGLVSGNQHQLQVQRAQTGSVAAQHAQGAGVVQLFGCPIAGNEDSGGATDNGDYGSKYVGYLYPSGFKTTDSKITVGIASSGVSYWDPLNTSGGLTGQFDFSQANCWNPSSPTIGFANLCPSSNLLPQCDSGLELVTITGTDSTAGGPSTNATLQIQIRRVSQ